MSEERNDLPRRRRRSVITEETPQTQGPDSRIPVEARRMSAAPYGAGEQPVRQRPGTRSASGVRRPVQEPSENPYQAPANQVQSRVRIGYAPGRMSEGRNEPEPVREPHRSPEHSGYTDYRYQQPIRQPAYPPVNMPRNEEKNKSRWGIHIPVILLIIIGIFLAGVQMLPQDHSLRQNVSALAEKAVGWIPGFRTGERDEIGEDPSTVPGMTAAEEQKPSAAPGTAGEEGQDPSAVTGTIPGEQPDGVTAEDGESPDETETVPEEDLPAASGITAEEDGTPEELADDPGEGADSSDETGMAAEEENLSAESRLTGEEGMPEEPEDETEEQEPSDESGITAEEASPETTPAPVSGTAGEDPAEEPEEKPEPTVTPALTAEAAPGANPDLLSTVTVYSGKKKVKDYNRAAKEMIRMPAGWAYTKVQMGVLTFRGNAFRTNGAVGTVPSANEMVALWEQKTGNAKGSNQVYSGTGWPGQPAIVQWSRQVRESANCNIYEAKKEKKKLKEVIVPGMDGVIRFLDLDDGTLTRNSIKLGYPLRGTPSIHTGGFTYMNVGQYARKMKAKTGKIGLRQYNLYTQKELTLIDGLDTNARRALNNTGSFETSALIDRTSDSVITAGSNGMLYLISLNSEFDWNIGVYTSKPSTVVMVSKTKAEKNAQTAVESSVAAYDRYVYYADMGGILRCVDTNSLSPVWAVDTGDSVMAAVALDIRNEGSMDLYTANMLNNRKKGNAQIRRYDALNGKEIWCTEIGVQKDTKKKTDSGCKASPVIGENVLKDMVYYTVTGLNDDGRALLNVAEGTKAALVALDKDTGEIRWAYGLSDRSESSPIAIYDEEGNGRIIQCAWDGTIVMVDGLTGKLISSLEVIGNIEASPAAFNDIMVIGTTGTNGEMVYGIRIQ